MLVYPKKKKEIEKLHVVWWFREKICNIENDKNLLALLTMKESNENILEEIVYVVFVFRLN